MPSDLHREKEFDAVIRRETQHMTGPVPEVRRRAQFAVKLCGRHRNHLAERRGVVFGGRPQNRVVWYGVREGTLKVGKDHERLWLDRLLLDVFKAGAEAGSTSAHWFERNRLALFKDGSVVDLGVEIEYMHPLGPPLRDDGIQFILEESKLATVDRPGAVHADYNFTHAILANAWQV
jgi:hypothetical protein